MAEEKYTFGHAEEVVSAMSTRSAANSAWWFTRYLQPGSDLLDVGCGPGTITVGFASVVGATGSVVGVDGAESQVRIARENAEKALIDNISFEQADAYSLPFADDSFDAVYSSSLLEHLSRPAEAVSEMVRVARPGGIIGARDGYGPAIHMYQAIPMPPLNDRGDSLMDILAQVYQIRGGDLDIGIKLSQLLTESNCEPFDVGVDPLVFAATDTRAQGRDLILGLFQGEFSRIAIDNGLTTPDQLDKVYEVVRSWPDDPGSMLLVTYLYAVARVGANTLVSGAAHQEV